jgi:catechol 2,3-dioxygenase-like lactoylglutathione lyase family enzyme
MIRGIHGLLYSSDPDATRSFFRTKLRLPGGDIGGGWWIFDFKEGDLGVHPVDDAADAGGHDVSFYCDDLKAVVKDLQSRDVTVDEIADRGYGYVTHLTVPGGIRVQLYQPKYTKSAKRPEPAKKKAAAVKKTARRVAKKAPKKAPKKGKKVGRR